MIEEPLVLMGDEHVDEGRVGLIKAQCETDAAILDRKGTDQRAVPVGHLDRGLVQHLRQVGARHPPVKRVPGTRPEPQRNSGNKEAVAADHWVTTRAPVAVLARYSGRYMSSTVAAEWR